MAVEVAEIRHAPGVEVQLNQGLRPYGGRQTTNFASRNQCVWISSDETNGTLVNTPPLLLFVDDYHLGDVLFLQALARSIARRPEGSPIMLIHGTGEPAERALEARGFFPERDRGLFKLEHDEEYVVVERAVRVTTRRLAGLLTDALVHAVALSGSDRGLLVIDDRGEVSVGNTTSLRALLDQQVVPVMNTLALDRPRKQSREAPACAVVELLARALEASAIGFFPRSEQLYHRVSAGASDASASVHMIKENKVLAELDVLQCALDAGHVTRILTVESVASGTEGFRVTSGL